VNTISFSTTKLLSLLVYPLSQALLLLFIGVVLFSFNWRRTALTASLTGLTWLYLCSTAFFADFLMGWLERGYPARAMSAVEQADVIVLIGGAARGHAHAGRFSDLNQHADRIVYAVELYKAGKAPTILVAGGGASGHRPEASQIKDHLEVMGVPGKAILLEIRSRNTYDNALYTAPILKERKMDKVLLVTSAFHMPRAVAVFREQGLEVQPAPTDHKQLVAASELPHWLPASGNLLRTTLALHEMAGFWVYRWRGWL
jgi:uncharacterized SAM-binding protein YcdF (DUF218 family)